MEFLCRRTLCESLRTNSSLPRRCVESFKCGRNISSTITLRAGKPSKRNPKSKKPQKPQQPQNSPPAAALKEQNDYMPRIPKAGSPEPGASHSTPKPKSNPFRYRIIPIFFGSIALVGFSGGISYLYIMFNQDEDVPRKTTPDVQEDVSNRYDQIATTFDNTVDSTESIMGISSLRSKLVSQAVGDVLEVSIGTGRNLEYYSWNFNGYQGVGKVDEGFVKKGKVRSLTAVDKSREMLEVAHEKFGRMFPGILGVRWIIADAAEKGAIPGPPRNADERGGNLDQKYDTVVQTMGLCSVRDPVALLRNLGECVTEDEGRILLLEHGRGKWDWLNDYLDRSAEGHAKLYGCWWNRDIMSIIEESGLEVVKIETPKWWHGGTTWWIELKKPKTQANTPEIQARETSKSNLGTDEAEKKEESLPVTSEPKKKGWW